MKPRLFAIALALTTTTFAQDVVSARAGLINYLEGNVLVNDVAISQTASTKLFSQLPEVKENSVLSTKEGRVEVLLTPGSVLRLGEDSAVRMVSSRLADVRIEVIRGGAVVVVDELLKENAITLLHGGAAISPMRTGVYQLSLDDGARLKVFDGKAEVVQGSEKRLVKKGTVATLGSLQLAKFDVENSDSLLRWSRRRAGYLALANVSAAKTALDSGYLYSGSCWTWNPYFGMFTYIPMRGVLCNSFYGYCYYSPSRVYAAIYRPVPVYSGGGGGWNGGRPTYSYNSDYGYTTASGRSYGGFDSGASVSAGAPAATAAPAESPRSAESAVGRGDGGGGRSQ
jgi:hypothetical protein